MDSYKIKEHLRQIKKKHKSAFISCGTILTVILCKLKSAGELTVNELAQYIYEVRIEGESSNEG